MVSRRSRAARGEIETPIGLRLRSTEEVLNPCRRALQTALEIRSVGFDGSTEGSNFFATANGDGAASGFSRRSHRVLPLPLATGAGWYWLGCNAKFEFSRGNYFLQGLQLLFFEGARFDELKTLLLRAEWGAFDRAAPMTHAQPHWHAGAIARNRIPPGSGEVEVSLTEPEDDALRDPFEYFHLAMAARWHDVGRGSHTEEYTVESSARWVAGCIAYAAEQLSLVARKSGR
jgi:hypothetical protein